eukprot:11998285-Karenia_brevis.AAC.1
MLSETIIKERLSDKQDVLFVGDWNESPKGRISALLEAESFTAVEDAEGEELSTRWAGTEKIDWVAARPVDKIGKMHRLTSRISDHKMVKVLVRTKEYVPEQQSK